VRGLITGIVVFVALCAGGCARKDPAITRIEGSEPQRLSFGAPQTVKNAFVEKMKLCWFNGPNAVLAGHEYDLGPARIDTANGAAPLEQVAIFPTSGPPQLAFLIQFHAFNDNTLIVTRNQGFPPPLAAYLKRDVEGWLLERDGCAAADASGKDGGFGADPAAAPYDSGAPSARLR
jgi:hypothetical protein